MIAALICIIILYSEADSDRQQKTALKTSDWLVSITQNKIIMATGVMRTELLNMPPNIPMKTRSLWRYNLLVYERGK
jgi:hypothetical protein